MDVDFTTNEGSIHQTYAESALRTYRHQPRTQPLKMGFGVGLARVDAD